MQWNLIQEMFQRSYGINKVNSVMQLIVVNSIIHLNNEHITIFIFYFAFLTKPLLTSVEQSESNICSQLTPTQYHMQKYSIFGQQKTEEENL